MKLNVLIVCGGILALIFVFFIFTYLGMYFLLFKKSFLRFEKPDSVLIKHGTLSRYNDVYVSGSQWFLSKESVNVKLKAHDGILLNAQFLPAGEKNILMKRGHSFRGKMQKQLLFLFTVIKGML